MRYYVKYSLKRYCWGEKLKHSKLRSSRLKKFVTMSVLGSSNSRRCHWEKWVFFLNHLLCSKEFFLTFVVYLNVWCISVLNTLSEYTYLHISKNITSYTFLLVFKIIGSLYIYIYIIYMYIYICICICIYIYIYIYTYRRVHRRFVKSRNITEILWISFHLFFYVRHFKEGI